ncbi:MAG: MarR family winged helix-turn-helix transcriptional regulator [Caulobacterales bacterium]
MTRPPFRSAAAVDPAGEFPLDVTTYLFHLFTVIAHHRDAALDRSLRPMGLSLARHRALSVIASMEPCGMTQLAEFSAVDRTTMTRTVDHLVAAGLVERTVPTRDRRQVLLTLTPSGREAIRGSLKVIYRTNRDMLEGIPEDLQRVAARVQEMILTNLVEDDALARRLLFRDTQRDAASGA